jgi:hypothetical protein
MCVRSNGFHRSLQNIGSAIWNFLRVTLLARRILRWFLNFGELVVPWLREIFLKIDLYLLIFFHFGTGLKSIQLRGRPFYSLGHGPSRLTEQDVDWVSDRAWTLRSIQISITLAGSRIPIPRRPTEAQSHFYKRNTLIKTKFTLFYEFYSKYIQPTYVRCDNTWK